MTVGPFHVIDEANGRRSVFSWNAWEKGEWNKVEFTLSQDADREYRVRTEGKVLRVVPW